MGLDPVMSARMTDTVTVAKYSSVNAYGDRSFSTATTSHGARVEYRQHLTVNQQGQTVVARGTVYVGPSSSGAMPSLEPIDQVTLSDGTTPPIISVDRFGPDSLMTHEAVHFG